MCGIAGILNFSERAAPTERELQHMARRLAHRGPDGSGFYRSGPIGLAHTRLSIIDLAGGQQPIHNERKTVWVVFNGEIFNYVELRRELERAGHQFYTASDTEVLVHLYEEDGERFVDRLNGQFAIALWDDAERKLILTRDRAGILPLYYASLDGRLLFASEIKAILPVCGRTPRLSPAALDQLMSFWSPVSPATVFDGVFEVAPGEMIVVADGSLRKRRYWDWTFPEEGECRTGPEGELAEELESLLVDATRIRLRADVPVGAYLSGGLDSSILAALIHRERSAPLCTFSIAFDDPRLDESAYQGDMARHLGTQHRTIRCTAADIAARFAGTVWSTESPMLRTAPVPMQMLSGLVRESHYKVVLTGEGADEVFGGYDLFKEAKIRQFWARRPESRLRPALLKRLYPYLDLASQQAPAYLASFFGIGLESPNALTFSHLPRWSTTARCKEFYAADFRHSLTTDALAAMDASLPAAMERWHPFQRAQYLEAKSLMAGYLLSSQGDRMLMSHSVEGRFPYLDHRVIEFANRLHPRLKMKVLREKYLLKRALGRHLPPAIRDRYKQPYRAPDSAAFTGGNMPESLRELLQPEVLKRSGYFEPERVRRLVQKIDKLGGAVGAKDNMAFVGILSTQIWHALFVEDRHEQLLGAAAPAPRYHAVNGS